MKTIITSIFLLLPIFYLPAQKWEPSTFHYNKQLGLPSNLIYGSLFDQDGQLWLCTDAGVVQFDGSSSKLFTIKDGLPSNDVYHMFCDSKNRIWFTTLNHQVSYYLNGKIHNSQNDSILKYYNTKSTFPTYFENYKGDIFILSNPLTVIKFNGREMKQIQRITDERMIIYKGINCDSSLLLISDSALFNLDFKNESISKSKNYGSTPLIDLNYSNGNLFGILENEKVVLLPKENVLNGKFFYRGAKNTLYCNDGVFYLRKKYGFNIHSINTQRQILNAERCSHLNFNINKSLWISSFHRGLISVPNPVANTLNIDLPNSNNPLSILRNEKSLYIGTENSNVIVIDRNGKIENLLPIETTFFDESKIVKILVHKNNIYFGDNRNIYRLQNNKPQSIFPSQVSSIKNFYFDKDSLIVLYIHGVVISDLKNHNYKYVNNKRAYSYIKYKNQKLFGTQDSLMVIDHSYHPYQLDKPLSKRIMDLQSNGDLLFALTSENGLYIIRNHNLIDNINTDRGLCSNNCGKSTIHNDNLYIATDNGIAIYNFINQNLNAIHESDGLASNMVNDICIKNDTLYAATDGGVSVIPISSINHNKAFNLFAKPFAVKKDTIWERPLQIVARTNQNIHLVLNATTYIKNTKKTYTYRIKELDSLFTSTLDKNINLKFNSPGLYTFEAFCYNAEGTKSKPLQFTIYIKPYFHQTIWFYLLLLAILALIIYLSARYYANKAKLKEQLKAEEEKRIRGLEIAAWRSNVNPHFIFNSLNGLQAFFRRKDFDRGNSYLSNFTQILRTTVDTSNDLTITVEQEIEYLREFLTFEQNKRYEPFSFTFDVDQSKTLDYFIPSLVVQPILENSLKHALSFEKEGLFHIRFFLENNKLVCKVADNGPGIQKTDKEVKKSVGLSLIRYKLRIIEKIIKEPLLFFMKNLYDAHGKPAGLETTFVFPILTKQLKIDNNAEEENVNQLIIDDQGMQDTQPNDEV